ncbi:MAG TPA: transposase [Pyrinomonadaceae bacterium]|nr:transposase [Pyrinomonadaceae bacterium]
MRKDYVEFQDISVPKAYFLSFRGYGTWLHGDVRFSMDRKNFNRFGSDKIVGNSGLLQKEYSLLKNPPFIFNGEMRKIINEVIREVCEYRKYHLIAINTRTNHVHCVVAGNDKPESIMTTFKSYITRRFREGLKISTETKIWSRHGSTKYLWTDEQIEKAVDYVINGQGDNLPDFI